MYYNLGDAHNRFWSFKLTFSDNVFFCALVIRIFWFQNFRIISCFQLNFSKRFFPLVSHHLAMIFTHDFSQRVIINYYKIKAIKLIYTFKQSWFYYNGIQSYVKLTILSITMKCVSVNIIWFSRIHKICLNANYHEFKNYV